MLKKRNLIFLSLLILGVFLITGCWLIPSPTYTVTFDSQGGSAVDLQTVERGGLVIEPTAPTRTGYAFAGWYKELECTNTWDFDTDTVTSDVTLYAQWTTNTYTVTFNSQGGSTVSSQTVAHGGKVTEPTAPICAGHTFSGWYEESGCTNAWDFNTDTVISNVTLYAKWMGSVHNTTQVTYYTAIQPALNAAATGDNIEVNDGTYAESITFPDGILITLKSVNGATSTFITGDNDSATVTCVDSLQGTTLEGFTITHNSGYTGKGITIAIGYLTINNCTISDNSVTADYGGGIYNNYGTLTITDSEISGNSSVADGGGIYNEQGTVIITSSTISGNSSANYAGGIHNWSGTLTITGGTIFNNHAESDGGGIYNESGTLTITGGNILNNSSANYGGGIYNESGTLISTITDSEISGNSAPDGGGIYHWYGDLTITSSIISGNSAATDAGGIYNHGTLTITDSEISGNSASDGGGIYIYDSSPIIKSNTISGNTASLSGGGIYIESGSPTIGGADGSDTGNFNNICGNTLNQIDPNPVAYPNNYIFTNCDVIGETGPAGGLIFYDKGEVSNGWRYLEAAPSDQSTGAQWGCYGVSISGADGTVVGTGEQNTIDIETGCATVGTAADICANLSLGSYDDWFLPSKDELNKLYLNKVAVGGFADYLYWSSSEYDASNACFQHFYGGYQNYDGKNRPLRVRAVRAF